MDELVTTSEPWDGHNLNALEAILSEHYLAQIVCDHDAGTDQAICNCSQVDLGVYPSVGRAAQSWVDHVMAEVRGKWSLDALLRRAERLDSPVFFGPVSSQRPSLRKRVGHRVRRMTS